MSPTLRTSASALSLQSLNVAPEDGFSIPAEPPVSGLTRAVKLVLVLCVGGSLLWGATAPLSSAVTAPGVIAVESFRKTIRSLDGGIVAEVLVRDGQRVADGDPLLRLEDIDAQSNNNSLQSLYWSAQARMARLQAEASGAGTVNFPAELLGRPEVAAKAAVESERALFQARRAASDTEVETLRKQIAEQQVLIRSSDESMVQVRRQLVLLRDEMDGVRQLYDKGLAPKTRLLALQRSEAELQGRLIDLTSRSDGARQRISVIEAQILEKEGRRSQEVANELKTVSTDLAGMVAKLPSTEQAIRRKTIVAPQGGVVVGMTVHGEGAVVRPADPLLDIVPDQDEMVIQVHITPTDIDAVHVGLPAEVRFPAFRYEQVPKLMGELIYVSADRMVEPNGTAYFEGRVRLVREDVARLPQHLRLLPGMNADVLIVLGSRTFLRYLLQPLLHTSSQALSER